MTARGIVEAEYPLAKGKEMQAYADYPGWKGKITWMTPDKFLQLAAPLPEPVGGKVERLQQHMAGNKALDPLVLLMRTTKGGKLRVYGHEGRHRALAAKKLGITSVPVLIAPYDYPRVPEWTDQHHANVDKGDYDPEL